MTCRQLGGPCDLEHRSDSVDEVIKSQDHHLRDAEKSGDTTHQPAREAIKGRWRHPKKSLDWYGTVKTAFAGLPAN